MGFVSAIVLVGFSLSIRHIQVACQDTPEDRCMRFDQGALWYDTLDAFDKCLSRDPGACLAQQVETP